MSRLPIGDYALVSDCHTAGLISRAGSIDWLPFPRFDSPAVFCRLLDDRGGHFSICPVQVDEIRRAYREEALCLKTIFRNESSEVVLEDMLAVGPNDTGHELGAEVPHTVIRRLRCTNGKTDIVIEFEPRPEYGLISPVLRKTDEGVIAQGGAACLFLTSPIDLDIDYFSGRTTFKIESGDAYFFALEYRSTSEARPEAWPVGKTRRYFDGTLHGWHTWSAMHQNYQGPYRDMVHHSGRVLQGLTYYPTGAIVAAPTTSLPETVGGVRNWDYRYTWIRDASFTHHALWVAACPDEAYRFFDFMASAAVAQVQTGRDIQIVFGIGGEHDLSERELPHLSGWRGSRPVRVGNGAWTQRQIDVYGELLDAAFRMKDYLEKTDRVTRHFMAVMADAAAERWRIKDQGIWEIRGPAQHFVYSKIMCWVALDRAIALADILEATDKVAVWKEVREQIADAVSAKGWNENIGAFTQTFENEVLDASNLMIPIVGFLPGDDPRVISTIAAVERELTDANGLVYRYRSADGLEGEEGTFLLCTFWLAHALALAGKPEKAREAFERAAAYMNDVGLLAEEIDGTTGELIGNFPQAFSHIGLINAAWAISEAENK
ncbi:MAG: glycoside hydrolase family 15 protein [Desulfobacterales bacterium]